MCLIVAKPKGTTMPSQKKIKQWFAGHPDGFGLAVAYNGQVKIIKGATSSKGVLATLRKLIAYMDGVNLVDVDILLHFRTATHGQPTPANCHPFPLTKDASELAKLDTLTTCAVAHNGMIFDSSSYGAYYSEYADYYGGYVVNSKEGKTDTQKFIEDYMVDLGDNLWNPTVQKLIVAHTESKFALLTNKGFTFIGQFIEDGGCYYSNLGYLPPKPVVATKLGAVTQKATLYKPYEPNEYETNVGVYCDGCGEFKMALYYMPDDDQSLVCGPCYLFFTGKQPTMEEQVF